MKTTILATAVLMALSFAAHAESFSDVKQDAKAAASGDESEQAKLAAAEKAKKDDEAKAKADKEAEAKKSDAKPADEQVKRKTITGFKTNDDVTGDLEVGIVGGDTVLKFTPDSCKTGSCTKVVLFTSKNLDDMKALRDAFGEVAKTEDKKEEVLTASERRRKERETADVTEKEVREEIALMLSTDCGIDEDAVKRGSRSDSRGTQTLDVALDRTRFAGLEIPEKSRDSNSGDQYRSDAECSASVLKEFMDDHETEDLTDLKDKLVDLKSEQTRLKSALRLATTDKLKASIEKDIEANKAKIASAQKELDSAKKTANAYDRATLSVARRMIINPAVNDLATRKFFTGEDFFLHDLAATTSDAFKGVRQAASSSLLEIYRKQSQSYLAFNEMAAKTTDPTQKLQYQQTALFYQQAGMNYNAMMGNIRFKGELGHSAAQAGLDPKSILEEIYGNYNSGAQEITDYLSRNNGTTRGTTAGALPEALYVRNEDGTYSQVPSSSTGNSTAGARGNRVGAGMTNAGRNVMLARPLANPPNGFAGNNNFNSGSINSGNFNSNGIIGQSPNIVIPQGNINPRTGRQ